MPQLKKISNVKVKPIDIPKVPEENVKGKDLFAKLSANIFELAKKESGKTTTTFTIIKECCGITESGGKTKVIGFVSTAYKDKAWIAIREWLDAEGFPNIFETSIVENGVDKVRQLIDYLDNDYTQAFDNVPEEPFRCSVVAHDTKDEDNTPDVKSQPVKVRKPRKPKHIAMDYLIIVDDMSKHMTRPSVAELTKQHRHYSSKVIFSSQNKNDLAPDAWQQMDYIIAFPNIPERKLLSIYEDVDLTIPPEKLFELYNIATKEKYNFLYIDVRNNKFRKNFDEEFILDDTEQ